MGKIFIPLLHLKYKMKISELEFNQRKVEVEAVVQEIGDVKEFSKFGNPGRVAAATIKDDSGEVQLTLWNEQIDLVKKGDKIRITNGYIKEWQGEKQLNIGRYGELEVLE